MPRACISETSTLFKLGDLHISRRTQYNTKLKEWRFEKNIKEKDMKAIARKELKRKAENPLKSSSFRLRGKPVPARKIERYMKQTDVGDGATADEARESGGTLPYDISPKYASNSV